MAVKVFRPINQNSSIEIRYGDWMAKCCASIVWRILYLQHGLGLDHFDLQQLAAVERALETWSDFMSGRIAHPGIYELHVLPVGLVSQVDDLRVPTNINRYLTRSVEMDVARNSKSAFVYAKMCKLIVVGFIQMPKPKEWKGTRVAMKNGVIGKANYSLPRDFGEYLFDRARRLAKLQSTISDRQRDNIAGTMRSDPDRSANSATFEALQRDVSLFGDAAFEEPDQANHAT